VKASALRRALRRQRKAMREQLGRSKARLREQLGQNPALRARARQRRLRAVLTLAIVVLLLSLLRCCSCGEGAPAPVSPPAMDAGTVAVKPAAKPPLTAPRLSLQRRGDLKLDDTAALTWLDEFRLQVAARSPKLANCFRGADRPGALRWTTAMNPGSGQVSNHELEPMGGTLGLNPQQRECLIQALSEPRYQLRNRPPEESSTPSRVSIMLEF
jgi:hypothetical protein